MSNIEWREVELGEVLNYEQPGKYIVESIDYKEEYKTPVLTAGKSFILGYTNETEGIYNNLPVIIFDDFTTDTKFVNFNFKVKSSAMKMLTVKDKLINLKFVFLMMQGIRANSISHKRYYLSVYQNKKIPIPFSYGKPDLKEQERIVKILEKVEKLKERGKNVEKLLDESVKSVFNEMFLQEKFLQIPIMEANMEVNRENPSKEYPEKYFNYVDISSIDNKLGKIVTLNKLLGSQAPSRARQKIMFKDLLISTVRPNLNTVALVPEYLNNQICSTGFCVIRLDPKRVLPEYLFILIRSKRFIDEMTRLAVGASYPGISDKDILNFKIPLPPISLQQKFAKIVEQVEGLKENVKKTKQNSEELFNSLMNKAFKGEL